MAICRETAGWVIDSSSAATAVLLDRASALLSEGGLLVVEEFAWDWADAAAAAWFYDAGSLPAAAGPADFPREPGGRDPAERWRAAYRGRHPAPHEPPVDRATGVTNGAIGT
jgi:hypothetical protein